MKQLLSKNFNTKKLELYLNTTTRGFLLLQVNDKRYEKQLMEFISSKRSMMAFDLQEIDFRDSIECLKTNRDVQAVLYYSLNFRNGELRSILEKINLSRDLLLAQEKIVVFIVPQYIASMIQTEFPNLYSYFILKEEYIIRYPFLFEYIPPGKKYLVTRDSQSEFKKFYYSSEEGIEERLDYFMQRKMKEREFRRLKSDFSEYLDAVKLQKAVYDQRYYYSLLLRMANVCVVQEDYAYAFHLYNKILVSSIVISQYQEIYYEANLRKADIYLHQRQYRAAIEAYKDIITMISCQHNYNIDDIFFEYVVKIYPRIAICLAENKQYGDADAFMKAAFKKAEEREDYEEGFAIIYNRIILAILMETVNANEIMPLFETLKKLIHCDVQKAMYLSIYAWYRGVIGGHCRHALEYAYDALALKRKTMLENDIRIAESHYVISILYLLLDDTEHAKECKKKCVNILNNYKTETEKVCQILKMEE